MYRWALNLFHLCSNWRGQMRQYRQTRFRLPKSGIEDINEYIVLKSPFENVRCEHHEDDTENLGDFKAMFMVMFIFRRQFATGCTCGMGTDMGFAGDFSGGVLFA